jgi:hypothetical protein
MTVRCLPKLGDQDRSTGMSYKYTPWSPIRAHSSSQGDKAPTPSLPSGKTSRFALAGDRRSRFGGGLCIAQIVAFDRLEVSIELIDQRDAVGDIQIHDGFV